MHGGRIWAENRPGWGTTISFTLPTQIQPILAPEGIPQPKVITGPKAQLARQAVNVLVIGDNPAVLRLTKAVLNSDEFHVIGIHGWDSPLETVTAEMPDLVLLDIARSVCEGLDVCARIREFSTVPIVIIGSSEQEEDIVHGLDAGADDYVVRPFRTKEFIARIRAVIRRNGAQDTRHDSWVRIGELIIDFSQQQVKIRDELVFLTPTAYRLIYYLAIHAGRVLTHTQILCNVWGHAYEHETQYVWVNISRLRKKIEDNPRRTQVHSHGAGCRLLPARA
jgi:two-component system KDP operon response regulator KdpE